jgi:hypothetical protein
MLKVVVVNPLQSGQTAGGLGWRPEGEPKRHVMDLGQK